MTVGPLLFTASKLTNMLASGRPVLATTDPETALGQEVIGAGQLVPAGDAPAMAAALDDMLNDEDGRAEMGKTARARALDRWDMDAILSRLKAEFETLCQSSSFKSASRTKLEDQRDP